MAIIHVDGKQYEVDGGDNLLHACLSLGLDIPYFCWHPALGSVGACRQCAVKSYRDANDKQGRIVMSCMTPSADGTYISIDDEDPKAVQTFLTRKKMSGWVGVDASGGVFGLYGVESRPTTIIVDGNGKIVAVTEIDSLSATDLRAVAEGKNVAFKPTMEITEVSVPSSPDAERALFAVSVSKASPDAKTAIAKHPPTGTDVLGEDADGLITDVFNVFGNRYVLKDPLPAGRYDVRVNSVDVPQTMVDSVVQQAVLAALHLQIESKTLTRPAYILRATDANKKLLSPSASTHAVKRGYWHGNFLLMNGTMDDLAYVLATGLENPVLNETGIDGTYDARFKVAGGDVDSLNAILKETLGLELVPGNQEMSITVLEVSKQEKTRPSPSTKTQTLSSPQTP